MVQPTMMDDLAQDDSPVSAISVHCMQAAEI